MIDINYLLENDTHLIPLLKQYLSLINPELASSKSFIDEDYTCLPSAMKGQTTYRMDVLPTESAVAYNITQGYWDTVAHALKKGLESQELSLINIALIINHSNVHWTSAVASIEINEKFYAQLANEFKSVFNGRNLDQLSIIEIKRFINSQVSQNIFEDNEIYGIDDLYCVHYDSHQPGLEVGQYYQAFKGAFRRLKVADYQSSSPQVQIESGECARQTGMTCGDHALFNAFISGSLFLDPHRVDYNSDQLRNFTDFINGKKLNHQEEKILNQFERMLLKLCENKLGRAQVLKEDNEEAKPKQLMFSHKAQLSPTNGEKINIDLEYINSAPINEQFSSNSYHHKAQTYFHQMSQYIKLNQKLASDVKESKGSLTFNLNNSHTAPVPATLTQSQDKLIFSTKSNKNETLMKLAELIIEGALQSTIQTGEVPLYIINSRGEGAEEMLRATLVIYEKYKERFQPKMMISAPHLNENRVKQIERAVLTQNNSDTAHSHSVKRSK